MKKFFRSILQEKVNLYKSLPYTSLVEKTKESDPVYFDNGLFGHSDFYQGQIIFVVDDQRTKTVRIIGSIDDGKQAKLSHNVIIGSDGTVLSENMK